MAALITHAKASAHLGLSPKKLRRWIKLGDEIGVPIPFMADPDSGRRRYNPTTLEQWAQDITAAQDKVRHDSPRGAGQGGAPPRPGRSSQRPPIAAAPVEQSHGNALLPGQPVDGGAS